MDSTEQNSNGFNLRAAAWQAGFPIADIGEGWLAPPIGRPEADIRNFRYAWPNARHGLTSDAPGLVKPAATGRILLWRGGSLWIGLAGEPSGFHSHHAVQIALPFPGGRVRFQIPAGHWRDYPAALVMADRPHAFEARGQKVAQLFVEPESQDGIRLQERYHDEHVHALSTLTIEKLIAALANAYGNRASNQELIELARTAISAVSGSTTAFRKQPDARIAHAIDLIHKRVGDTIPLKVMAAAVHLSPERFRHLFMEETGVGFRVYLLWLRLERSLAAYVGGKSLTEAAQTGGFSDSAHFSRTFKRMFGITPGSVRPE